MSTLVLRIASLIRRWTSFCCCKDSPAVAMRYNSGSLSPAPQAASATDYWHHYYIVGARRTMNKPLLDTSSPWVARYLPLAPGTWTQDGLKTTCCSLMLKTLCDTQRWQGLQGKTRLGRLVDVQGSSPIYEACLAQFTCTEDPPVTRKSLRAHPLHPQFSAALPPAVPTHARTISVSQ